MTEASESRGGVWIVMDDQTPGGRILAVCASADEVRAFADEVAPRFPGGIIYSCFEVGYRYDAGPNYYEFPSSED